MGNRASGEVRKKVSFFKFPRHHSSETLTKEEESKAFQRIQRSLSTPINRRKSSRFGFRGRRHCIQEGQLRPEQQFLTRIVWRTLTVALPQAEGPGAVIFRHIFQLSPDIQKMFTGEQEDQSLTDTEDSVSKHMRSFTRMLDTCVLNVQDLDTCAGKYLENIGRRHHTNLGLDVKEEYFSVFAKAMNDYMQEMLERESVRELIFGGIRSQIGNPTSYDSSDDLSDYLADQYFGEEAGETDPMEAMTADTLEAWRSLVMYIISKIHHGYEQEKSTPLIQPDWDTSDALVPL